MTMMGHNSAAYGQMLKPIIPVKPPSQKRPKSRFPYFKFYPRDWLEATRDMTLEARGAYIDLICILMEMEGHLSDNDKWIAHQMHVSPRKWRGLKGDLIEHKKISISDGRIVNERCLKELDQLMNQRQNLADSAVKRERTKRETPVKHPGNIGENFEKINEINASATTPVALRARVLDTDTDLEEEKQKKIPASIVLEAARGMHEEIDGLNGATILMQTRIAKWMNPIMPKHRESRTWLTSTVQLFGSDVVRDAFAAVEAKHASDEIVGSPIKLMNAICQKMAGERKKGNGTAELSQRPPGMPESVWQEILAGQART